MDSIRTLVDENGHGRVRAGIRHILKHSAHDDGIADNETQALPGSRSVSLAKYCAEVHAGELHQALWASRFVDDLFHLGERLCGGETLRE